MIGTPILRPFCGDCCNITNIIQLYLRRYPLREGQPALAPYQYPPTPSPAIPPPGSPRWHTPLQPLPEPTPVIEDMVVYVAVGKEVRVQINPVVGFTEF